MAYRFVLFSMIPYDLKSHSHVAGLNKNAVRRTCMRHFARFQLTRRIARSLGDSWASCLFSWLQAHTHTHTHTHSTHNRLTAFVRDYPGRPVPEETFTHSHPSWSYRTSFIIFLHLQRSMASSLFSLRAWQSSRTTSLQVLLALDPQLYTPCISSSNHNHLFAAHAHTKDLINIQKREVMLNFGPRPKVSNQITSPQTRNAKIKAGTWNYFVTQ